MGKDIDTAFRRAQYRVFAADGDWRLQPDRYSPDLAIVLARRGQGEACLLTAFNPRALAAPAQRNRIAQAALCERLRALDLPCLAGENAAPDGDWREPSLLVLGLGRAQGLAIAREFGQLAILHAGANAVPRLVRTGLA